MSHYLSFVLYSTLLKVLNVLTSILLFAYFLYPLERITVSYWT